MPDDRKVDSPRRLLAATVAANPNMKLDYGIIASFYGGKATRDEIEKGFRLIEYEAEVLKTEKDNGLRLGAPGSGSANNDSPEKPKTPKKSGGSSDGVLRGPVTKSTTSSRSKKRSTAQSKQEMESGSTPFMVDVLLPSVEHGDADEFANFDLHSDEI